jgi:hypothetical protein
LCFLSISFQSFGSEITLRPKDENKSTGGESEDHENKQQKSFLGGFTKLLKATIGFVMSVCPYVRQSTGIEQLGSHRTDVPEI